MKAMIFAAGLGTRLRPLTDTMPKALVPLNGHSLLEYQLLQLRRVGIEDVVINVHHFPDMIIDYLQAHDGFGCRISISDERQQLLNTGGGLHKALPLLKDESVLALNVDILSNIDIAALISAYHKTQQGLLVVSERRTQRYLCFDEQNMLCGWTNINTGEVRGRDGRHLAFSGMQILPPSLYRSLDDYARSLPHDEDRESEFSLIDYYLHIAHQGVLQAYIPTDYRMMDVGKYDLLSEAEAFARGFALDE